MGPEGSLQTNAAQAQAAGLLPSATLGAGQAQTVGPTTQIMVDRLAKHNSDLNEFILNIRDNMVRLTGVNVVEGGPEVRGADTPQQSGFIHDFERELMRYGELNGNLEQLRTQLSNL